MIDLDHLQQLISGGETISCEFKSDKRQISDNTIFEEIVALANTNGGTLLIGIENNGKITGATPRHGKTTDSLKLQSAIFNNTVPSINTRIFLIPVNNLNVLGIEVDAYREICATASGKSLRRSVGPDGKPQTIPFYPRDQRSRRIDLELLDFSAQIIESVTFEDLDPLEFERLRQITASLRGDHTLLELNNEEIAKALRLVESRDKNLIPNIAGLLLLGREEILLRVLPTHQVLFQVLDSQDNVRVNDSFTCPLLHIINELESRFAARNEEDEVQVGMFRLPIPDYSPEGFREATNNAILHRNYTQLESIYIQWHFDHLLITNPGGFPEGVTIDNILVHEPKPRNPRLADAFRRIGLIEQTGRGVDKIYKGQLRYGRPLPDYSRSDSTGVRIVLHGGRPSMEFAAFVYDYDRQGDSLKLDELIILNELFFQRRIDSVAAAKLTQKSAAQNRAILEHLQERGLIEARGEKRARVYHLASSVYERFATRSAYIRAKGFESHQNEQMVIAYTQNRGRITRSEATELCSLTEHQASYLLRNLAKKEPHFQMMGQGKGTYYIWMGNEK